MERFYLLVILALSSANNQLKRHQFILISFNLPYISLRVSFLALESLTVDPPNLSAVFPFERKQLQAFHLNIFINRSYFIGNNFPVRFLWLIEINWWKDHCYSVNSSQKFWPVLYRNDLITNWYYSPRQSSEGPKKLPTWIYSHLQFVLLHFFPFFILWSSCIIQFLVS